MHTAVVIPFPASRRVHFVARHAVRAAELAPTVGDRHLAQQVEIQRQALTRKGVDPDLIEREMRALEGSMRAALWRAVLMPGERA